MGHLECCYLSAPIDCLPKSRRVGCVCLFCRTNGHHLSTHLSASGANGKQQQRHGHKRDRDRMRGICSRLINKNTSNPNMRDSGGGNADGNNYGDNYFHGDETLLIRQKNCWLWTWVGFWLCSKISQSLLLATAVNSVINYSQLWQNCCKRPQISPGSKIWLEEEIGVQI